MKTKKFLALTGLAFILSYCVIIGTEAMITEAGKTGIIIAEVVEKGWFKVIGYPAEFTLSVPKAEPEPDMKEWIRTRVEAAGMVWDEVNAVIEGESRWRPDICIIEPNDTISCGLWMLNTVHNKGGLTNACKTDYKCATEFAIGLYQKHGWQPWSVAKKLSLK